MTIHKPFWFSDNHIMVSTAPTCGLTKGGRTLGRINDKTGMRVQVNDPETGELIDAVDDQLLDDMIALKKGSKTSTLRQLNRKDLKMRIAVPIYYDYRFENEFLSSMKAPQFKDFEHATLSELVDQEIITIRGGHGSPSQEQRVGEVPYIKVSDLRAGLVNINPTNRVPLKIAERHWGKSDSDLRAFDLLSPERTSKNIGDFCLLMPGQERVLLTKEIIVIRPGPKANFDAFYLLWALTLKTVRQQWKRIVFMQTNREDVGKRYLEISIPITKSLEKASEVSEPFRKYFQTIATARAEFAKYLKSSEDHHFFVSGAVEAELSEVEEENGKE
jgi:hypothetical protein